MNLIWEIGISNLNSEEIYNRLLILRALSTRVINYVNKLPSFVFRFQNITFSNNGKNLFHMYERFLKTTLVFRCINHVFCVGCSADIYHFQVIIILKTYCIVIVCKSGCDGRMSEAGSCMTGMLAMLCNHCRFHDDHAL